MRLPAELTREPKEKKAHQRKTDPQASRLYLLERYLFGAVVYTRTDHDLLRSVAAHACREAKVSPVEVRFIHGKGIYGECDHEIRLNLNNKTRGDNMSTLLHELGHWIDGEYFGQDHESHGPEFVTVYRWLLDKYRMLPAYCFDAMCRRHSVKRLAKTPTVFQP